MSKGGFLKLRAAVVRAVWSRKQPLLLVLVLYLAFWMDHTVVILLFVLFGSSFGFFVGTCLLGLTRFLGCTGFLILFVMAVPVVLASLGTLFMTRWDRPGLPGLSNLAGPIQHFSICNL